jgi:branched-chain amino acid aminotransferase
VTLDTRAGTLRIWLDGETYDSPADAALSAVDHGLVVGNGVFETLKVTAAGVIAVSRHLARLERSARTLGLPQPDLDDVRAGIAAVTDGQRFELGKVRITYTGGLGPLGSEAPSGPATLVVAADAAARRPPTARVATSPWTRNERGALTGVKSTSYAENVRALAEARTTGADEAIFLNTRGHVCEGTGSNLFCVFGDRVVTPPLSAGPLAGITRDLVLEIADVTEADLTLPEALGADEVFLTSSMRDIQGVSAWDDRSWTAPGTQTRRLATLLARRLEATPDA